DLGRGRQTALLLAVAGLSLRLVTDDVVAQLDAFVADEYRRPGNQFADFMLALAAEGAVQQFLARALLVRHVRSDRPDEHVSGAACLTSIRRGASGAAKAGSVKASSGTFPPPRHHLVDE